MPPMSPTSLIKDPSLASKGETRIDWAREHMPIMRSLHGDMSARKPFKDLKISICLHVEAKTAVWVEALTAGGAEVFLTGSPGSTQDDTAAALASRAGVHVFAAKGENYEDHLAHCRTILDAGPDLIADNGGDLHALIYSSDQYTHLSQSLLGATEETTTGATRLRTNIGCNDFPTLIINDTQAKRIVENRFGVGSSVVDAVMRATNIMLHGKSVLVVGYGYCGSGVAQRFRGMGAHVSVAERAPLTRLEAHLEGFKTVELEHGLETADIVVTVTGHDNILTAGHFDLMQSGTIIANAGHFATEVDGAALKDKAVSQREIKTGITEFTMPDQRKLFLLSDGNLVNLAAGDGNPIEVMDLGLALQTLSLAKLAAGDHGLQNGPQTVPADIENFVAEKALEHWL